RAPARGRPRRVLEADRAPVDLRLAAVDVVAAHGGAHVLVEGADLLLLGRVLQAEHGRAVAHLRELLRSHAADPLRGRGGGNEVGPLLLDAPQVKDQRVELRIRDLRLVEHEVGMLVTPNLLAQSLRALSKGSSPLAGRLGGDVGPAHFERGASMPDRILRPALSNFTSSSSSVRVSVLFTTVPMPNAGCVTRSPVAKRCTGGGAGAACTCRSWNLSLYPWRGGATGAWPWGEASSDCGMSARKRLGNA